MGAIFGVPAALIAIWLLYTKDFQVNIFEAFVLVIISCITFYLWAPAFYWTTMLGNHICFLDWGQYVYDPYSWARTVPLIYIVLSCGFSAILIKNIMTIALTNKSNRPHKAAAD